MLRATVTCRGPNRGSLPVYHRGALSLTKGSFWRGNFGANGRWLGLQAMSEPVRRRSLGEIDREMLNYVHSLRERHEQMVRSFHQVTPSATRRRHEMKRWLRMRDNYLQTAFKAFVQYKTKETLREQARLVTKYSQAGVNRALGDVETARERQHALQVVQRAVMAPVMQNPAPKNIVTRFQHHPDRFDRQYRIR